MLLLNKNNSVKKLILSLKKSGGRNSYGRITVYHRGQGARKKYRVVDFFRTVKEIPGKVRQIEYSPGRNSFIALICYKNSMLNYILAGEGLRVGDIIISSVEETYGTKVSNSTKLSNIGVGFFLHGVEYFPGSGAKVSRAAGSFCQVLKKINEEYILLRLKSKEYRVFFKTVVASFGVVSNRFEKFRKKYKAGQTRYLGIKPVVRGEAKNPVDHPHGGNTSGGKHPRTPSGALTKGVRTRNKHKISSNFILKTRHV